MSETKGPTIPGLMPPASNKSSDYAQIKSEAGVCLVGKRFSGESNYIGRCSGNVIEVFPGFLLLVTSESIFSGSKEELAKVKRNPCEWNDKADYVLCFKSRKKGELKTYKLDEVSTSNERVIVSEGLVIIPLDSKKLSNNFKKYRPFKASFKKLTDSKPFDGSICRIVKGNTESFMVESYKIEYVNGKECVLSRAGSSFDTLSKLTANGAFTECLPSGAGIFKDGVLTGVLNFIDDQIFPVPFWSGALFGGETKEPESSDTTLVDDKPGQAGELDEPGNHDTKVGNNKTDQESRKSSLTEVEGRKSDESEIVDGVKAQLERSGAGVIKETDPYKGTGATPKRPGQGNSRKPATSRSKDTLAEEADESKEKNHDFSNDKILPYAVQVSTGLIEDREEADEVLEENGANRKAPTESRKGSLTVGGSKNRDAFSPGIRTTDGKLPRDENSDQSDRTFRSTETLAEEKNIFLKDETRLPVQESSKSSSPKGGSRREDAISPGRSTKFGEISGQGSSKIALPTGNNGASASPDKDKGKQPRHENKVSVENDEENDQNTEKLKVDLKGLSVTRQSVEGHDVGRLDNNDNAKGTQDDSKTAVENEDRQNGTEFTVEGQANGRDESDNNSDGNRGTPSIEGQESQITQIKRRRKSETPPDSPTICRDASRGSRETQRKEPPGKATGVDCNFWVSNEVAIVFLRAVVVIAVVLLIAFVYHKNKPASCSGAKQL